MNLGLLKLLGLGLALSLGGWAHAEQITLAVAANFTQPMTELAHKFEQASGHKVRLAFGSSGQIYAQIKQGAPYQAFFSADQDKPIALINEQLAFADSRFTYATGALALWTPQPNSANLRERLRSLQFNKLALANAKLAPYGQAAREVLDKLALTKETQAKWVEGANISQTYQFVATGNADLGFVALAQIMKNHAISSGSAWVVPTNFYHPLYQDAVLLRQGAHSQATKAFLAYVQSPEARTIISAYGYHLSATPSP